jgi:DNA repair protein RadA
MDAQVDIKTEDIIPSTDLKPSLPKSKKKMESEKPKEVEKELNLEDLPGVGAATAEKLKESGYDDLMSVAVASPGKLIDDAGITETAARKMINAARNSMKMGFVSGEEVLEKRGTVIKISTGSEVFNEMMGGGFETAAITEVFSEFGGGKTQIGHILSVNMLKQDPDSYVVYIDTENTFRPERIAQLAKAIGLDPTQVLKKIKVAKAYNSDHQMLLAEKVSELIKGDGLNIKLVVVDSLMSHFRAEYVGRGTLADRQQKLNRHMHVLARLADTNNLCVYVTNQVMSKPDQFFGDPTTAVGGHIVGHASTFRIYLRKGKKGSRVAKLVDSPNLPETECNFMVTEGGLEDL